MVLIFLFILIMCVLVPWKHDLLYHLSEFSIFGQSESSLDTLLENPGGLISWIGTFLTQSFHFPWLGAAVFAAVCVLLAWLVSLLLPSGSRCFATRLLASVPSVMCLLFLTRLDYSVYIAKDLGFAFSMPVGLCFTASLLLLNRHCKRWVAPLVALASYPLLGIYSLVSLLMMGLVPALFVPVLPLVFRFSPGIYLRMNDMAEWFGGLPFRSFVGDWSAFIPAALAAIAVAACLLVRNGKGFRIGSYAVAALSICGLFVFSNYDRSFAALLKIERAVEHNDWQTVIRTADKVEYPTRAIAMYKNVALYNLGFLCDDMFSGSHSYTEPESRIPVPVSLICSPDIYFYTGQLNSAERWAMELAVSYGKNIHQNKTLAKVALISGDEELARKYLDVIGTQPFQSRWVKDAKDESRYSSILPLIPQAGSGTQNGNAVEGVILKHFSELEPQNNAQYLWKMASLLTIKSEAAFMQAFLKHCEQYPDEPVPANIAQAAVLFGANSGDMELYRKVFELFSGNKDVLRSFSEFGKRLNSVRDMDSEKTVSWFREHYGDTYWFYYYFVKGITTN